MVKVVFSLILSSLLLFLPCQIGVPKRDLGCSFADAKFTLSRLPTPIETVWGAPSSVPASPTMMPSLAVSVTVTLKSVTPIVTSTGFVEVAQLATSTGIATDVLRAKTTPAPLLDSLVRNRPSIWGNKGFYVLLGLVYIALLALFIKQILSIPQRKS